MAELVLTADSYEQRVSEDGATRHYERGDRIEPRDKAEAERLVAIGAAEEPGASARAHAEKLQAEAERLKAEAEAAEQHAESVEEEAQDTASGKDELSGLSKEELVAKAEAEGVAVDPNARKAEIADTLRAAQG